MLQKIKWLFSFYERFPFVMAVLIFGTPLVAAVVMVQPVFLKPFYDSLPNAYEELPATQQLIMQVVHFLWIDVQTGALLLWLLFGVVVFITYSFLQGSRAWMNVRLEWAFRQQAFSATTRMGPDFFNKFRTGDLVTRMTDDVQEKLSWFACSGIFRFYEALLLIVFGVVMMTLINSSLALYVMLPLPILILVYSKTSALLDRRFDTLQKRISDLNGVIESCFSGIRVVKAFSREEMWKRKFAQTIDNRRQAEIKAVRSWVAIESLWFYVWNFAIVILLLAGGYLRIKGEISFGDFMAFESYTIIMIYKMFDVGSFLVKGRQSAVSIGRVQEIENYPLMVRENGHSDRAIEFDQIKFDHVSFGFDESGRRLVNDVDFTVQKGETIALVGKVGSGKSWLINLLTRQADPSTGTICLDKQRLRDTPLACYRNMVGYVPQEPILFSGTIEENIRFGNGNVTESRLDEVVDLSQLGELVKGSPDGLKTRIGTRGINISGGEKQRLSIARALVRNPRLLLLDDCTSALDTGTEERLWEGLNKVMPEMTCFVVTHRTKTLRKADRIFVFDEGKIIASGTHGELLQSNDTYRDLYAHSELKEQVGAVAG